MKLILDVDEKLFEKAAGLSGISEKSVLVDAGLKLLIQRESARCLALLGGTEPQLRPIPR